MNPSIEVLIDPQGNVRLQAKGFAGPTCRQVRAGLEAALGLEQAEQPTPEFYQTQTLPQQLPQKS